MPVASAGTYNSLYGGDIQVLPTSHSHHEAMPSRPAADYRPSAVPVSTTTYAVRKEPVGRSTSVKETGSRNHRSPPPFDPTAKRPIIVTTKHAPDVQSSSAASGPRPSSPSRDPYRSSDEAQYYAQPASSIRSRSTTRAPFSAALDNDEYQRLKERTEHDRLVGSRPAEPYRSARPQSLYASAPAPRPRTLEYEDDGYEYAKPGDLVRYDLDHDRPRRSRRDSVDRYYRPTVSVTTDIARPYEQNDRRTRGPPPTTWGLDKVNRGAAAGLYEGAGHRMPIPPAVPLAPDPARRSALLEAPSSPTSARRAASRTRPISLIQDTPDRSVHNDDYYRHREDDLDIRDSRRDHFQDSNVTSRGFGIRVDPKDLDDHRRAPEPIYRDERRERRDHRRDYDTHEPRRRSDEDLEIIRKRDYEDRDYEDYRDRRDYRDRDRTSRADGDSPHDRRDRPHEASPHDEEHDSRKDKLRDRFAAGLGIAAASVGLGSAVQGKDDRDKDDAPSSRRHKDEEPERRRVDRDRKDSVLSDDDYEIVELPQERSRTGPAVSPHSDDPRDGAQDQHKRDTEDRRNGDTRDQSSSADEGKAAPRRRRRASSAFNPNDTASLAEIKAQLAAAEDRERDNKKEIPAIKEASPERKTSLPGAWNSDGEVDDKAMVVRDETRGRELVAPSREEKQVRVVSPPREKEEKKPIKGILKQPKPQFPEEPNPIREGVAPHKDDKTKANVPPGARWTKISRKMVNPEALTIGKERFEVRDDFVIVLRVLSKDEIQAYADATAQLRGGLSHFPRFI